VAHGFTALLCGGQVAAQVWMGVHFGYVDWPLLIYVGVAGSFWVMAHATVEFLFELHSGET
jgi:hypothetical protein